MPPRGSRFSCDSSGSTSDRERSPWRSSIDSRGHTAGRCIGFEGSGASRCAPTSSTAAPVSTATTPSVVLACQQLLEFFPDVGLGRETARQFAERTIRVRIEKSGREIYAPIERRAAEALAKAGDDPARLRALDTRFPHSRAAAKARDRVFDRAVQAGDLATAAAIASRGEGPRTPGVLRRLMVAAGVAKNRPLARAIGDRLLARHGATASDYGTDGGKTMAEVVQLPALPVPVPVVPLEVPVAQIGAVLSPGGDGRYDVLRTEVVSGYPGTDQRPLYVGYGRGRLLAFQLGRGGHTELFSVEANLSPYWASSPESLRLCGIHLIVNDGHRIRALHFRTGEELWSHARKRRTGS